LNAYLIVQSIRLRTFGSAGDVWFTFRLHLQLRKQLCCKCLFFFFGLLRHDFTRKAWSRTLVHRRCIGCWKLNVQTLYDNGFALTPMECGMWVTKTWSVFLWCLCT
jgi:hypothetical protein